MEYVFGVLDGVEVVTTKGPTHTDLTGFHQVERSYPDQIITDYFRAVRKQWSGDDSEGNCYDRYEIDKHYRVIDKTVGVKIQLDKTAADLDYLYMMSDIDIPMESADEGFGEGSDM